VDESGAFPAWCISCVPSLIMVVTGVAGMMPSAKRRLHSRLDRLQSTSTSFVRDHVKVSRKTYLAERELFYQIDIANSTHC
jgi:hypothetical protein